MKLNNSLFSVRSSSFMTRVFALALMIIVPSLATALAPIARWDIVPHQRLAHGATLNIGVVAFSRNGINNVSFAISGQGASTTTHVISSMSYNTQTGAFEYWFSLPSSDFSSNGVFTVTPTVYGVDGESRVLDTYSFIVDATGALPSPKAWVSPSGSNSTGSVNDRTHPFLSLGGAEAAIQAAYSGTCDGATIYLFEGTYSLGEGAVHTTNEWVTLTKDQNARKENTIITNGGSAVSTAYLRIKDITVQGTTAGHHLFYMKPATLWVDGCDSIGEGRTIEDSNPIMRGASNDIDYPAYYTDVNITNVARAIVYSPLCRNVSISHLCDDAFVNVKCIINCRVTDSDSQTTYWHNDIYQTWGDPPSNRVIYGLYGTDLHGHGFFTEQNYGTAQDVAWVNILFEMRMPGRPGNVGGTPTLSAGMINYTWDNLLMWNCSFVGAMLEITATFTNCSFIGNLFDSWVDYPYVAQPVPYGLPGNVGNNVFLNDHYVHSFQDQGSSASDRSHSPDSSVTPTHTYGDPKIDLSFTSPTDSFCVPASNSPLLNRISNAAIIADALGRQRDNNPDLGALERGGIKMVSVPTASASTVQLKNLRVMDLYP